MMKFQKIKVILCSKILKVSWQKKTNISVQFETKEIISHLIWKSKSVYAGTGFFETLWGSILVVIKKETMKPRL